jgi:hypothetical protein
MKYGKSGYFTASPWLLSMMGAAPYLREQVQPRTHLVSDEMGGGADGPGEADGV